MLSHITVYNDTLIITDPTKELTDFVKKNLCYTDKAKQYQLRRMARNKFMRNTPYYTQLKKEITGTLYEEDNGKLIVSSCFYDTLKPMFNTLAVHDLRGATGSTIVIPWINKSKVLRDYQKEALTLMLNSHRGLINLATGLGKTMIATHLVQQYKKKALIVCPNESVAKQFYEQFVHLFGKAKVGFYGSGKKTISDVTVGIAASIAKNISAFQSADLGLVILDETHHVPATTFYDIARGLGKVGKLFGLTATAYRSDGKDIMITAGCGPILIKRDIKWGIDNGWLAVPYFLVREVPTTGKDHENDKGKAYKEHVLNNDVMKQQIFNDAQKMMGEGKSVLILVDEVAHGEELSKQLSIPFATGIDAKSQSYVDQLNAGKIKGLVGTDGKISEGTDTRNVDALILANFVASKGPVIQAVGRGLRKQGNKTECLILDYIPMGSTMLSRHGYGRVEYYREITDKVLLV